MEELYPKKRFDRGPFYWERFWLIRKRKQVWEEKKSQEIWELRVVLKKEEWDKKTNSIKPEEFILSKKRLIKEELYQKTSIFKKGRD